MKLIKKILVILGFFILTFVTVNSQGNLDSLMKQLESAKERLSVAERALQFRDSDAFMVYKKYPFMPESTYAEIHMRNAYPKEYHEYIQAKGDLDDIEFLIYTAKLNILSQLGE